MEVTRSQFVPSRRSQSAFPAASCRCPDAVMVSNLALRLFAVTPHQRAHEIALLQAHQAGIERAHVQAEGASDTCSRRTAIAFPCSGPSVATVCSTIRSSVPWRTSLFSRSLFDAQMKYQKLR